MLTLLMGIARHAPTVTMYLRLPRLDLHGGWEGRLIFSEVGRKEVESVEWHLLARDISSGIWLKS